MPFGDDSLYQNLDISETDVPISWNFRKYAFVYSSIWRRGVQEENKICRQLQFTGQPANQCH